MAVSVEILVVGDELDLGEMVAKWRVFGASQSTRRGTVTAMDGETITGRLQEKSADLAILDINMPGEDGLTLARRLCEDSDVCIMMLTAAGGIVDRVVGLEMGADDYVAKPFNLRELLARVRTVLCRRADADIRGALPQEPPNTLRFERWLLDLDAHKLMGGDVEELYLRSMPFDRSIDIRVVRLRKKIERNPTKPEIIKTIPGAGYMYVSERR